MIRFLIMFGVAAAIALNVSAAEYGLEDLHRLALLRSEKIKISEEDVFIAEKMKDKARSLLIPRFTSQGAYIAYSHSETSPTGSLTQPKYAASLALRLDQSMSMSGREITAFRMAKYGIEKGRYDLFALKEGYMLSVSVGYYDYLRAKRYNVIAKTNAARLTKHRDAASTRLKVGEVTKTALLRAEAELSGARSEVIRSENNVKLTRAVLARIVGLEGDFEIRDGGETRISAAVASGEDVPKETSPIVIGGCDLVAPDCLKEKAFAERAELKSLNLQRKIAEDQVRYARGAYWPTISAEGVYQSKDENPSTQGLVADALYGGVRLSVPIFEGGLRAAEVQEAAAKKRQAEYSYADLKKAVGIEVDSAYLDFMTQKGVLKSLEDELAFANDNYNAVARQFEFGLANSIDVMDANNVLVNAEIKLADAVYNYGLATMRLKRVTGVFLNSIVGPGTVAGNRTPEAK